MEPESKKINLWIKMKFLKMNFYNKGQKSL